MRSRALLWFAAGSFAALCASCGPQSVASVKEGAVDLRGRKWKVEGPATLLGRYQFYWNRFVDPHNDSSEPQPAYLDVPGKWNKFPVEGGTAGGIGFGTYRLRISVDRSAHPLALRIHHFDSNFRMYVNGALLASAGRVGQIESESEADRKPGVVSMPASDELDIVMHVSNFHHANGGMPRPLILGSQEDIEELRINAIVLDVFLCGSLLIMAIYHFGLFVLRPKDLSPLYFGFFCLLIVLRTAVVGERILLPYIGLADFFPAAHRLEYLSFYLSIPVFYGYTRSVFPSSFFPRIVFLGLTLLCVAGSLFVLATRSYVYSHTSLTFQLLTVLVASNILAGAIHAALKRRAGAGVFLAGFAILFAGVINDILFTRLVVQSGFFVSLSLFLFIFTQAFLLSRLFAGAYHRAEDLALDLANSERRYRHLIEDSGEIIVSLDDDGRIMTANRAVLKILGYGPQELIGKQLSTYLHTDRNTDAFMARHIFSQRLRDLFFDSKAQEFPAQFQTSSGDACELNVRIQRIPLKTGHAIFANLAQRPADHLASFCIEDRREYVIENNFNLAEMLNYSLTAGLEPRLAEEDLVLARLALREITINAIEHGNLGITFEEKGEAMRKGTLPGLLQDRLHDSRYASRKLRIRVDTDADRAVFTVRDEGNGFDHRAMLARAERQGTESDDLLHGRGIAMALLFFDEILYNEKGNEVRLVKIFGSVRPQNS